VVEDKCEIVSIKSNDCFYNQWHKLNIKDKEEWITYGDCRKMSFHYINGQIAAEVRIYTHSTLGIEPRRLKWEAQFFLPIDFVTKIQTEIDKAFDKYILKQEVSEDKPTDIVKKVENKKWNLIERPDVKDKILEIKRHSEYSNIPMSIRNIFTNILKYNMASEKQIEVVENTYKRYFGRSH
jgi:hypothetical protein